MKTLTESLVVSNSEAEVFRRKYADLKVRMDALGVESASKDRAKLEQRLLKAVSDLQVLQKENDDYREQLLRLTETVLRYVKTSSGGDADVRGDVEAQMRATNRLLGKEASPPNDEAPDLMDGKVISVKEEWSLVVGNLGAEQGVKIGMPLRVVRSGRNIATLRIVDVRDKISGAVDAGDGFGKRADKSGRSPPGGCAPQCEFKINASDLDISLREDFAVQSARSHSRYSGPAGLGGARPCRFQSEESRAHD